MAFLYHGLQISNSCSVTGLDIYSEFLVGYSLEFKGHRLLSIVRSTIDYALRYILIAYGSNLGRWFLPNLLGLLGDS